MSSQQNLYQAYYADREELNTINLDGVYTDDVPRYFVEVFRHVEEIIGEKDLIFFLTWRLDRLPAYGNNVVAIVLGDEWSRIPDYAHRILATFKCYGAKPTLEVNPLRDPSRLNFMLGLRHVRTLFHYLPGWTKQTVRNLKSTFRSSAARAPIFDVPLGYGNQADLQVKPILERRNDLFFAGSIKHADYPIWSIKHWIQNPKSVSRNQMLTNLKGLQEKYPNLRIDVATMNTFAWNAIYYGANDSGDILDIKTYSERMMESKLCLVPRGTSAETFRYFEALRYGSIPIIEKLPPKWFYDRSPAAVIDNWNQLEAQVNRLLNNPDLLQEKHQAALDWWERVCSEQAVGNYIANAILALTEQKPKTLSIPDPASTYSTRVSALRRESE